MNLGGFEEWLYIIVFIVVILPFFLAVGAGIEGNWGAMFILLAIGIGLFLFLKQLA